jgi:hypothetical protein
MNLNANQEFCDDNSFKRAEDRRRLDERKQELSRNIVEGALGMAGMAQAPVNMCSRAPTLTEEALQLSESALKLHEKVSEHAKCLRVFGHWLSSVGPIPSEAERILRVAMHEFRKNDL